jgi:hypothetical protein
VPPPSNGETPFRERLAVGVDDEIELERPRRRVAKRDHLAEFPGGIDMQHRQRNARRIERLAREVQQDCRILAGRIKQHRPGERRHRLAQDRDAFRLELRKMRLARRGLPRFSHVRRRGWHLHRPSWVCSLRS